MEIKTYNAHTMPTSNPKSKKNRYTQLMVKPSNSEKLLKWNKRWDDKVPVLA